MDITCRRSVFRTLPALAILCLALFLVLTPGAFAKDSDYTQVGHNIYIGPNQKVSDLTCFGCSIHIRGQVEGDVAAFGGSIVLEDQAQVAGDVTAFAGNVRLDPAVQVAGDVTVFAGEMRRDPHATISGSVTTMGGRGWVLPLLLAPFVILGLFVALVIFLVRQVRRPRVPAAAA